MRLDVSARMFESGETSFRAASISRHRLFTLQRALNTLGPYLQWILSLVSTITALYSFSFNQSVAGARGADTQSDLRSILALTITKCALDCCMFYHMLKLQICLLLHKGCGWQWFDIPPDRDATGKEVFFRILGDVMNTGVVLYHVRVLAALRLAGVLDSSNASSELVSFERSIYTSLVSGALSIVAMGVLRFILQCIECYQRVSLYTSTESAWVTLRHFWHLSSTVTRRHMLANSSIPHAVHGLVSTVAAFAFLRVSYDFRCIGSGDSQAVLLYEQTSAAFVLVIVAFNIFPSLRERFNDELSINTIRSSIQYDGSVTCSYVTCSYTFSTFLSYVGGIVISFFAVVTATMALVSGFSQSLFRDSFGRDCAILALVFCVLGALLHIFICHGVRLFAAWSCCAVFYSAKPPVRLEIQTFIMDIHSFTTACFNICRSDICCSRLYTKKTENFV